MLADRNSEKMKKTLLTFLLIVASVISCNEASEEISGPTYDRASLLNLSLIHI